MLAIIGGSGIYDLPGLSNTEWLDIDTPFGAPSDALLLGELAGQKLAFLPRHGRGHRILPSELNFRANIYALKQAGATQVVSVGAVGSLKPELSPGTLVIVDQFVDRTFARKKTFFGEGVVAHVSMAHPVCGRLGNALEQAALQAGIACVRGGTYLVIEGPQFSTRAESELYRSWSCDVIGMTNMPEAKLAREAELCYATLAMVTDYDCWHPEHDHVTVDHVIATLLANADNARDLLRHAAPLVKDFRDACPYGCTHALDHAVLTAREAWGKEQLARLEVIAGRVLKR